MALERQQRVPPLTLEVLDHMRLIQDHVVPPLALEHVGVAAGERVGRDAYVEMILVVPPLAQLFPLLRVPVVAEHLEAGKELLELHLPVQQYARRYDDEMRTPDSTIARKVG